MSQIHKKREQGFTIIEVLIVLAIAGLIMVIVFLAVPALQRNQRNTARKNDISRLGSAATEFVSNNNGTLPAVSAAGAGDAGTIYTSAGNLSQYVQTNVNVIAGAASNAAVTNLTTVNIVRGAKCSTSGVATTTGATTRQMALQYAVENSGATPTPICQDI